MSAVGAQMTCREMVELVTDYLEGRLGGPQRARFEAHLAICPGCQAYLEQMRQTLHALGRIPEETLPAAAREELLQAFRAWKRDR
ncbi:MAG TPA: zf-HC2 domain-containing protein [Baekduia sp.]|nr:zf-HC2 domain-containing protein [Baekduia sp.]